MLKGIVAHHSLKEAGEQVGGSRSVARRLPDLSVRARVKGLLQSTMAEERWHGGVSRPWAGNAPQKRRASKSNGTYI